MLRRFPAWSLVLAASVSVQFGAAIASTLFDELGPAGVSLLRLGFSAAILLAVWRPAVRGTPRADLRLAVAFGLVLGTMNLAFYLALDRIPLGIAVTIEFAGPLGVAVVGSRRRADVLWAALAAAGIVTLAFSGPGKDGGPIDPAGVLFALIAAGCWAGYILLAQRTGRRFTGGRGLALASAIAVAVPLVPGLVQGGGDLLHPAFLLVGLGVALLSSVIPYSLEFDALRRMPANVFGVLMSLDPALAAFAGFVVLGQSLGALELAAIACVVTASVGVTRGAAPDAAPVPVDR